MELFNSPDQRDSVIVLIGIIALIALILGSVAVGKQNSA